MKKLILTLCLGAVLMGCNNIGSNSANISASTNNYCSPITNSNQCTITLTYNTNGVSGLSLGVTYDPQQYSQFSLGSAPASCPTPSSSGGDQTCLIPVTYTSTGTAVSQNIVFTLGTTNSNTVTVSGN